MNCSSCQDNLDLYVLGALEATDREAVEAHLVECHHCRHEVDKAAALVNSLATLAGDEADHSERLARLRGRLNAEIATTRKRRPGRTWLVVRIAAMVAVLGAIAFVANRKARRPNRALLKSPVAWRVDGVNLQQNTDTSCPVIRGETVLVLENRRAGNNLRALNKSTGLTQWRTPFFVASRSPAADDSRVFVWRDSETHERELIALEVSTGAILWRFSVQREDVSNPAPDLVVVRDRVCWVGGSAVNAVDATSGDLSWRQQLETNSPLSTPVSNADYLYVASNDCLAALHIATGDRRWQSKTVSAERQFGAPLLHYYDQKIVVAHRRLTKGTLRCHDAVSGRLCWERPSEFPIHSLALAGNVYVRSNDVFALDGNTGHPLWSSQVGGCSPLAVAHGRLYTLEGRSNPLLLALDLKTGERAWTQDLASSCSGLVIAGKTGYMCARDGALYAVRVGYSG